PRPQLTPNRHSWLPAHLCGLKRDGQPHFRAGADVVVQIVSYARSHTLNLQRLRQAVTMQGVADCAQPDD
ncbi:MAG: hypothetical protein ACREBD_11000, partial [Blastocatellia bacterium]